SEEGSTLIQLRCAFQRFVMALPTPRLDVAGRKNRLLPCQGAAVRLFHRGRGALSAMAYHAAELFHVVGNYGMSTVRLQAYISKTGFLQSHVAACAAIRNSKFRMPDLLNAGLKVSP